MGSSNSIFVQCEHGPYGPGEEVRGTVHINITERVEVNCVYLRVKGREEAHWKAGDKHRRDSHEFFRQQVPLIPQRCTLEPMQSSIPFAFVLPPNLPPTFGFNSKQYPGFGQIMSCHIAYDLKAEIDVAALLSSNIRHKAPLLVRQAPPLAPARALFLTEERRVTQCCCFSAGGMEVEVAVPTDVYEAGDTALIDVRVVNTSSAAVTSISAELVMDVVVGAGQNTRRRITLSSALSSGVPAGATGEARALPLPLVSSRTDGRSMAPSAHGRVVNCDVYIRVVLVTSGVAHNVVVNLPATILAIPVPVGVAVGADGQPVQAPPGWAPQVAQEVRFAIPVVDLPPPPYEATPRPTAPPVAPEREKLLA